MFEVHDPAILAQARNVLEQECRRLQLLDDGEHVRPEVVPIVFVTLEPIRCTETLTVRSAENY